MDVLLVESDPGVGAATSAALLAAGHVVRRCHPDGGSFPCVGLTGHTCPLVEGTDVAVVARAACAAAPTGSEDGVACALRAGLPVVQVGRSLEEPYQPWLAGRAEVEDVADAVVRAQQRAAGELVLAIRGRIDLLLMRAGIDPAAVVCTASRVGKSLRIRVTGDAGLSAIREAVGVRAYDAVRAFGKTFDEIHIDVG